MENRKVLIVIFAAVLRLLPHPANVAPIAGMALFGGTYINRGFALLAPLIALFISDIFLGFHKTIPFVYGSFLLTGLLGLWLRKHKNFGNIVLVTLASSLLFFLITNFGVWLVGGIYPHTLEGLVRCYSLAIPFFRNTLLGDMFYTGALFGGFELSRRFKFHLDMLD
jgi:hypothetical protein